MSEEIQICDIVCWALFPAVVTCISWAVIMNILKCLRKFDKEGAPKESTEYHNNAIYKIFDFYIKIVLALFGGISVICLKVLGDPKTEVDYLLDSARCLLVLISCVFTFVITAHQWSKIKRWTKSFHLAEPIFWSECWFVVAIVVIAAFTSGKVIPDLTKDKKNDETSVSLEKPQQQLSVNPKERPKS